MRPSRKYLGECLREGSWRYSWAISVALNVALIALALKIGTQPRTMPNYDDSIKVSISDLFTPAEQVPRPPSPPAHMPAFAMEGIVPSPGSPIAPSVVLSPPSALDLSAPTFSKMQPPAPILANTTRSPSAMAPTTASSRGLGRPGSRESAPSSGLGSGSSSPVQTSKNMIGGLDVIEKKLMVVTPDLSSGFSLGTFPNEYRASLKNRPGNYAVDMTAPTTRQNIGTFDEEFVSKLIELAESTKPEAIYWLHCSLADEHPPTRDKLINWLSQSGIPLYVSSWGRELSPQLKSAVLASKGEYEQRTIVRSPPVVIQTTPAGTEHIKDSLKRKKQWNPNMQEENHIWKGYLAGLLNRPMGKIEGASGVHFAVLGSSLSVPLARGQITPDSWVIIAESLSNERARWSRRDVMIVSPREGTAGTYIVKRDPKSGLWTRQPSPTIDDLVNK